MSRRALVLGNKGFIGRHIQAELIDRGWDTWGYDLVDGDDVLDKINGRWEVVDLVIHAAYNVGGRAAIDGINTNFLRNTELDARVFRWALEAKQKRVLYFSSSAAYPKYLQGPDYAPRRLQEDEIDLSVAFEPDANYGWAKLTGERMAEDARRNGLQVTVVRPASGCAADQSLDYPWPSIISRAMNGDMTLWGNPDQVRDWISVRDVVTGALAVVDSGTEDPVNLGTGIGTSMRQLATMAFEIANPGEPVPDVISIPGPEGVFHRVLDPTRLQQYYIPVDRVEDMVRETIDLLR